MNNIERCLQLDPLGAIESPINLRSGLSCWRRLWQYVACTLFQPAELRVWQRLDRSGNVYWQAYDPATGRSTSSGSDAEMRAWIEELRYHK